MTSHHGKIDSASIAAIAREVLRQLKTTSPSSDGGEANVPRVSAPLEHLVTTETLRDYRNHSELKIASGAVVTPAARELAAERHIQITTAGDVTAGDVTAGDVTAGDVTAGDATGGAVPASVAVASGDRGSAEKTVAEDAFATQLTRRGIRLPRDVEVIWTETPAREVYERCRAGQAAAMVTAFADVDRFARELSPRAWVLDRHKLNLVAAVNVSARIARLAQPMETSR
jgi:hypothetical protein